MGSYRISCEIEAFDGQTPLEAAKEFERTIKMNGYMQYYVQDEENNKLYSVDLDEPEGEEVIEIESYQPVIKI